MWAKRFRSLVRKIRQVRQDSPLRTRRNILTKMTLLKKIFIVTFTDFQHFIFRLFSKLWDGFPELRSSYPEKFLDKNCIILRKTFEEKLLSFFLRKIEQKFLSIFCKTFSPRLSEVQFTCPLEKLRNFFCWPKNM